MNDMPENDIVLYGLDQFLPTKKENQVNILAKVDEVMGQALRDGNPEIAGEFMKSLLGVAQISGLAFSKFVYTMSFQWKNFNRNQSFLDWALDTLGRGKKAINDNYRVWEMLVSGDIPKEYCEKLKIMPIRCLIPIGNLWKQDYEVTSSQWMKLANAPDPTTINKLIREIKGTEPKEGSIQIDWDMEAKAFTIWKNGRPHSIFLTFDETDEVVLAGLDRILKSAGILEKE